MVVEGFLRDVEFGYEIIVFLYLDDGLVVNETYRGTVVALVTTTTKGYVVAVHRARASDGVGEIGGMAAVIIDQTSDWAVLI